MATFNNEKYQIYANTLVRDVPLEYLKILITLFLDHSAVNMGANVEKANVDRIIEIVQQDYNFLPVNLIASAFIKGSMGYYGEGRLVPKIINGWLKETRAEYNRFIEHNERENQIEAWLREKPCDWQKYPFGQAICWKIDHVSEAEWDKVPLKEVAEIIGRGQVPTLQYFGITQIKTK